MAQIRYFLEEHHDDPDPSPDLWVPYLICDECNKPVKEMAMALVLWHWSSGAEAVHKGQDAVVLHKGYCDQTYEKRHRDRDPDVLFAWEEADRVLLQLNWQLFVREDAANRRVVNGLGKEPLGTPSV